MEILPPAKARISVLESVPIMSLPTRIPARNSSSRESSGVWAWISAMALEIDIATSMVAPSDEISSPEKRSSPTWISEVFHRVNRLSMSLTFQPEIPVRALDPAAVSPAMTTPATVPTVAAAVLRVGPLMSHRVTTAVTAHTPTDTRNGEKPR